MRYWPWWSCCGEISASFSQQPDCETSQGLQTNTERHKHRTRQSCPTHRVSV